MRRLVVFVVVSASGPPFSHTNCILFRPQATRNPMSGLAVTSRVEEGYFFPPEYGEASMHPRTNAMRLQMGYLRHFHWTPPEPWGILYMLFTMSPLPLGCSSGLTSGQFFSYPDAKASLQCIEASLYHGGRAPRFYWRRHRKTPKSHFCLSPVETGTCPLG